MSNVSIESSDNTTFFRHNIVKTEDLRMEQKRTLDYMASALLPSFGPNGSDTIIAKTGGMIQYTKDGRTIAEALQFSSSIARTTCANVIDIAIKNDREVGDGTTSAILATQKIFNELIEKEGLTPKNPYEFRRDFIATCDMIKEEILKNKKDFTPEAAYQIAMTSTNGDTKYSQIIKEIYEKYGLGATINVEISMDDNDHLKTYDGMTLNAGFSDHTYVNTGKNTCELHNPKIYAFRDHIDTPALCKLFSVILAKNIIEPFSKQEFDKMVPTVIIAPRLGLDIEASVVDLCNTMNNLKQQNIYLPLLIITNFYDAVGTYNDIADMCGCRIIKKYVDNNVYEIDKEKGLAPDENTVIEFCGTADMVVADSAITRFINPYKMYKEGTREYSEQFISLTNWLEAEIEDAVENGKDLNYIGNCEKRLASLKSNLVDLFIGGTSLNDRNQRLDLIKDAVKNCRSASKYGYGYGANAEALMAAEKINKTVTETATGDHADIIADAFADIINTLYGDKNAAYEIIQNRKPRNIRGGDDEVLTSIMTDYTIVDSIGRLVVLMYCANQYLAENPAYNPYISNHQINE